ncbi:MAG: hypothetical protein IJR57_02480 [Ruminococcus sp.]|nr:hypothetical protein [Ruminococcus sp.]
MKKTLSIILALVMLLSLGAITASAADSADIWVTIADKDGNLAVAAEKVTVTDTDSDGALTISDALYCAHEAFYEGGAAAGYATKNTEYGLSLDKLWGASNGGSYGYYLNGASAWSLTDAVKADDYLYAFVYTDLVGWSDKFSTFDKFMGDAKALDGVELTLTYVAEYDASYMPVFKPLAGADIYVNGEITGIKTGPEGKATVAFPENGTFVVTAKSADENITPPVFKATVTGAPEATEEVTEAPTEAATKAPTAVATPDQSSNSNPNAVKTGAENVMIYAVLAMMVLLFGIVAFKKRYEK